MAGCSADYQYAMQKSSHLKTAPTIPSLTFTCVLGCAIISVQATDHCQCVWVYPDHGRPLLAHVCAVVHHLRPRPLGGLSLTPVPRTTSEGGCHAAPDTSSRAAVHRAARLPVQLRSFPAPLQVRDVFWLLALLRISQIWFFYYQFY